MSGIAGHVAANQPSGAGRVVPPGTNLQYFDDDEPDISKNQGIAVEIEQMKMQMWQVGNP